MEPEPQSDTPLERLEEGTHNGSKLPVIGIGASAGGLSAIKEFFANVPADSGMAFVVILHLSPNYASNAAAVIQQASAMPVTQVNEAVRIVPNHVYVIPPNRNLAMNDGVLQPREIDEPRGRRAPIDLFFRALAEAHGRYAAAIVLSGSGADGAIGLQRVKEYGGMVMAQDPPEAEFDAMPRNAIATGLVDYVLPVAAMPARLIAYWNSAELLRLPTHEAPRSKGDSEELRDLFALMRARTGHDFSQYKRATLLRRIGRRMQVNNVADLPAYLEVLRAQPEEIQALLRDLLISVTNFFRDPQAWLSLEAVLPNMFVGKRAGDQVRAWVAGCATGEEAYTVAIALYEHALTLDQSPSIQIFATDIDEDAINVARHGLYPDTIAADVPPERLQRFFLPEQGSYRIKKEIRDLVLFAPHNLLRDPPFSKLDLITCRNLLIYLNRDVQEQVLQLFHFVLQPEGFLLLGASESTDGVPSLFTPIDKGQRLFQRRSMPAAAVLQVPSLPMIGPPRRPPSLARAGAESSAHSFGELHAALLAEYTPPSVIVNEAYEIVHLSRGAGQYLEFGEGEPSHNLLKVVHPDLRLELRTALFSARQRGGAEARRVRIDMNGAARAIDLVVQPIREPDWASGCTLVLFNSLGEPGDIAQGAASDAEPMVRQIEEELLRTKDQLRATVEQYETAVEEYKAANEELQAINEGLRAATEELETSKEELQSVNEELTTVNQELKHKVDEVSMSNNDLQNLMASTEIGTIFVDRELRIKRYTPSAQAIFNLILSDINRPLEHITHKLDYPQIGADAARVLETLEKIEREVQSREARWYLVRLLPYRTVEDKIDGVILTFVDITERREAEAAARAGEERLRLVVESVQDYAIFTTDPSGQIDSWNAGAEHMLGYTEAEAIGQSAAIIFTPEDRAGGALEQELRQAAAEGRAGDERWHIRKDGARFYASGVMAPLRDPQGSLRGFVKVMRDLTRQKIAEEQLQRAHDELEQRVSARTRELAAANARLQAEMAERAQAENARVEVLRRLVSAQEEERRRISRELHDQLGQQLSALRLGLDALASSPSADPPAVARLRQLAEQLDRNVDRLALELRPSALDDLGLLVALQQHVEEWAEHYGVAAEFQTTGIDRRRLPAEIETVIYRVAQEALTNAAKHAGARHVSVSVVFERRSGQVRLTVEDDGRGFDVEAARQSPDAHRKLGLLGMQERVALAGGTLTIESAPERGTTVFVRIPIANTGEA
jgi:two-component system CheB/CheR fusion protein